MEVSSTAHASPARESSRSSDGGNFLCSSKSARGSREKGTHRQDSTSRASSDRPSYTLARASRVRLASLTRTGCWTGRRGLRGGTGPIRATCGRRRSRRRSLYGFKDRDQSASATRTEEAWCGSCWCCSEIEGHTSHVIVHQRPHARDGSTLASKHLLEFVDNVEQDVVGGVDLERTVDVEEEEGIAGGEERHRGFQL
jgi:hypothetical protein